MQLITIFFLEKEHVADRFNLRLIRQLRLKKPTKGGSEMSALFITTQIMHNGDFGIALTPVLESCVVVTSRNKSASNVSAK